MDSHGCKTNMQYARTVTSRIYDGNKWNRRSATITSQVVVASHVDPLTITGVTFRSRHGCSFRMIVYLTVELYSADGVVVGCRWGCCLIYRTGRFLQYFWNIVYIDIHIWIHLRYLSLNEKSLHFRKPPCFRNIIGRYISSLSLTHLDSFVYVAPLFFRRACFK